SLGGGDHRLLSGPHGRHLVPVRLEARAERPPDLRLVVDDQHLRHDRGSTVRTGADSSGSSNTSVAPLPGVPSMWICPPCACTIARAIARPSPCPADCVDPAPR